MAHVAKEALNLVQIGLGTPNAVPVSQGEGWFRFLGAEKVGEVPKGGEVARLIAMADQGTYNLGAITFTAREELIEHVP
jgi:hypothetical protein